MMSSSRWTCPTEDPRHATCEPAPRVLGSRLAWLSLAWLSLAWLSLAWLSLAWLSLAWLSLAWLSLAWLSEWPSCKLDQTPQATLRTALLYRHDDNPLCAQALPSWLLQSAIGS